MAFSAGMYFENGSGNIVFAEHPNAMLNAQRGNYVTNTAGNGGAVTANPTSNLTTTTADIDIADVDTFNNSTINSLTGITSIDLSEAYDDLAAGQSLYVLIYIKSNGTISNPTDAGGNEGVGTPATTGQQLPPAIPENSVPLALITLTNGDTTVDAADIEDYRIEGPQGGYFNGTFRVVESGIIAFDINESTGHVGIGAASNSNYGVFIDAPAEQIGANQSFDRVRIDDQGAITVQTATTSTLVTTLHLEEPNIILTGTGAVTTAATFYVGGSPTEATNNYSIYSDAGDIRFDASQVLFNDENDSDVLLFDFDLLNRTIITGASGDTMAWTHWGAISVNGNIDLNNNNLDDVASIDGGGNAVIFDDNINMNGSILYGSTSGSNTFRIFGSDGEDTNRVFIHGGDGTAGTGAGIIVYGESYGSFDGHVVIQGANGTNKGDIDFYTSGTHRLAIESTGAFDFKSNDISGVSTITTDAIVINNGSTTGFKLNAASGGVLTMRYIDTTNSRTYTIGQSAAADFIAIWDTAATGGSPDVVVSSNSAGLLVQQSSMGWFKEDRKKLDFTTEQFMALEPLSYYSTVDDRRYYGFIADENVIPTFPEIGVYKANVDGDGKTVRTDELINYDTRSVIAILYEQVKRNTRSILNCKCYN